MLYIKKKWNADFTHIWQIFTDIDSLDLKQVLWYLNHRIIYSDRYLYAGIILTVRPSVSNVSV